MRTRDGVNLFADGVRPAGRGRFPIILERTPYGREAALNRAEQWAARGYAYIVQDCRGRGDSAGQWDPFVHEGEDGYDAVAWAARQAWCDGNVGMLGVGYAGTAQWLAAVERPPALRCIVPQDAAPDPMHGQPYENGVFPLLANLRWSHALESKTLDPRDLTRPLPKPAGLTTLPVGTIDRATYGRPNRLYQAWIRRPVGSAWRSGDLQARLPDTHVPALQIANPTGHDDLGTKLAWEAMRRAGRKDQWLVYGPWASTLGATAGPDINGLIFRFFETFLKGKDGDLGAEPRVQAYVSGASRWISLDGWPASNSTFETLYLAPQGLRAGPGAASAAVWNYDPARDIEVGPTGRAISPTTVALPRAGTYVLFQGDAVVKPTAIAGPYEVRLFFKSSAVDTDLFATLLDVAPDGSLRRIGSSGNLRASYRDSLDRPTPLQPGRTYAMLLRPGDAAHELGKGHRLGLLIESSRFPEFARNLGTGEPLLTGTRMSPQRNVILTGTVTPSRITFRRLW